MNRAILIVICDFLVSAMLAMMTGMVPAHTGGTGVGLDENTTRTLLIELDTHRAELEKLRLRLRETIEKLGATPEREAELRRIAAALAANRLQRERLQAHLDATADNTGKLTPQKLQQELDEERKKRYALEETLRDKERRIDSVSTKLQDTKERFQEARRDLAVNRRELSQTRRALEKTSTELVNMSRSKDKLSQEKTAVEHKLVQAESKIEVKDLEIRIRDTKLAGAESRLRNMSHQLQGSKGENKTLQQRLAYTTGQLHVREKSNAELKDALDSNRRRMQVLELERNEARLQRDEMQKSIKSAVSELSAARTELGKLAVEKTRVETKLETTEKWLKENSHKRSDVIANYSSSVVQVDVKVSEETMLSSQTGSNTCFYPVVAFARGNLIIGTLNQFAGDSKTALSFSRVTAVEHYTITPEADARKQRVRSAMLLHEKFPQAAAFEYRSNDRKALKLMTFERLKRRGLDGLFLFKCSSLGKESAQLDGRCSLLLTPGAHQLFIRNAGRANNELRAEPGDFILSREGEFVGLVIASDSADSGRVRGAKVMLFADDHAFDHTDLLPVHKRPGEKYFSSFSAGMMKLRRKFPADSRRW